MHCEHGLRFAIYTDDHEPAHVHVYGDGEAKLVIRGKDGLSVPSYSIGFMASDRRKAIDVVLAQLAILLAR